MGAPNTPLVVVIDRARIAHLTTVVAISALAGCGRAPTTSISAADYQVPLRPAADLAPPVDASSVPELIAHPSDSPSYLLEIGDYGSGQLAIDPMGSITPASTTPLVTDSFELARPDQTVTFPAAAKP